MGQDPLPYNGYKIFHFGDSFQHVFLFGRSTYQMTSFVVTQNDAQAYEFFFGLSTVESALHGVHLDYGSLVGQALQIVKGKLDEGELTDRSKYVYQYYFEGARREFRPVTNPVWMTENPQ